MDAASQALTPFLPWIIGLTLAGVALLLLALFAWGLVSLLGRTLPARIRATAEEALTIATEALGEANQLRHEWQTAIEGMQHQGKIIGDRGKKLAQAASRQERANDRAEEIASQTPDPNANGAVPADDDLEGWRRALGVGS